MELFSVADAAQAIVDPMAGIAREVPPQSRSSWRGAATIQKAIWQLVEGDTALSHLSTILTVNLTGNTSITFPPKGG
jgi:hypothetical protein